MKKALHKITNLISEFQKNPEQAIEVVIPMAIVLVSAIGVITGLLIFISNGGYAVQRALLDADMFEFSGIKEAFTKGTVPILYHGFFAITEAILVVAQLFLILCRYFKTTTKVKKGLMIVVLVGAAAIFASIGFVISVYNGLINFNGLPEAIQNIIYNIFSSNVFVIFSGTIFVVLFPFVMLVRTSESKELLYSGCKSGLWAFIILPLALLLIENIIPLAVGAGKLVLIIGIIAVVAVFGIFSLGGDSADTGGSTAYAKSDSGVM